MFGSGLEPRRGFGRSRWKGATDITEEDQEQRILTRAERFNGQVHELLALVELHLDVLAGHWRARLHGLAQRRPAIEPQVLTGHGTQLPAGPAGSRF